MHQVMASQLEERAVLETASAPGGYLFSFDFLLPIEAVWFLVFMHTLLSRAIQYIAAFWCLQSKRFMITTHVLVCSKL